MGSIQITRRASVALYNFLESSFFNAGVYLLPANVCPIVPAIFCKAGVQFKFVDISMETYCLDWEECAEIARNDASKKYNLLYVHSYGYEDPYFDLKLANWKKEFLNSHVIDDRCLARPSLVKKNELSDIELYSTGYSKLLEIGHTGWAIYNGSFIEPKPEAAYDDQAYESLISSFHKCLDQKTEITFDFALNWLDQHASFFSYSELERKIPDELRESITHRTKLNAIYMEYLSEWAMPVEFNMWRFNLLVSAADKLLDSIFDEKHFASRHYQSLTSMYNQKEVPNASYVGEHIVNLFNDHRYDEFRAEDLAKKLRKQLRFSI